MRHNAATVSEWLTRSSPSAFEQKELAEGYKHMKTRMFALLTVLALLAAACSGSTASPSASVDAGKANYLACLSLDTGGRADKNFNQSAYEGLQQLAAEATACGLDYLVEVHNPEELALALQLKPALIGINNRDLHTFKTSLKATYDLLDKIPAHASVITESGILARADVEEMMLHGVYGFLVGESFMRAADPGAKLQELFFNG